MSNFLNKLIGHSLGPSEAIQPRVPSIYEPGRRGSAPQWADFASRERREGAGDEIDAEANLATEPRSQEVSTEKLPEPPPRSHHPETARRTPVVEEAGRPVRTLRATPESHARAAVRGILGSKLGAKPGAFLRREPNAIISPSALPANTNAVSAETAAGEIRAGELPTYSAQAQTRAAKSVNADAGILSDSSLRESLVSSQIQPVTIPVRAAATPASRQIDLASAKGPTQRAFDSEPAIRVTIGRVEVRAQFPAPAPRRAQSPRPKPTLTLDNYLKRASGQR